jgi:hypothetical protein
MFQPKQIKEIKDFLLTARRKDATCEYKYILLLILVGIDLVLITAVKIKKAKDVTKFKVCMNRSLIFRYVLYEILRWFLLRSVAPSTCIHFALRIPRRLTSSSNHCRLVTYMRLCTLF